MFMITTPSKYRSLTEQTVKTYSSELLKTHQLETKRQYTGEHRQALLKDVAKIEVKLVITTCWQPSSSKYIHAI
jgi:hypothetical protein